MDNVFKKLRVAHCPKGRWGNPMSQYKLGKLLGIKQQTIDKVERGYTPSYKTVKAYHDYFHVPYETLFGEGGISFQKGNIPISKALKLSDDAINNIRNLSPRSLALLDGFLSNERLDMYLFNLFDVLHGIDNYINDKSEEKSSYGYNMIKYNMTEEMAQYLIEFVRPSLSSAFKDAERDKI